MPEETEIETHELQEHVDEAHEHAAAHGAHWTRYVALTTATFAAFAAVAALQSGAMVNEAMMNQLRASDRWNEYQADRQKARLYDLQANALADAGAVAAGSAPAKASGAVRREPGQRLAEYLGESGREEGKADGLSKEAKKLEAEASEKMEGHERFAYSVALLQVAIALGAVAALSRAKLVWFGSGVVGLVGVGLFVLGFLR